MHRRHVKVYVLVAFVIVLIGLGLVLRTSHPDAKPITIAPDEVGPSKQAGDTIYAAVYRYREKHGGFPGALNDLVPEDLTAIPQLSGGKKWTYDSDGGKFVLMFDAGKEREQYSRYDNGEWETFPKSD